MAVPASNVPALVPTPKRTCTVLLDKQKEYPEIWLDVYVSGPPEDTVGFAGMFARAKCRKATTPLKADFVVFSGGPDVDPVLYGESQHSATYIDPKRDAEDIELYKTCLENGIPMIGVCRGAQFLHVMNDGKLYQDVDHHYGAHSMFVTRNKHFINEISSVHHQMVRPNVLGGMEIVGEAFKSECRWIDNNSREMGRGRDIEAFFYRDTCCFGVQGHPEYAGYGAYTKWFLEEVEHRIIHNPDLANSKIGNGYGYLRIKPDLLEQRKAGWKIPAVVMAAML